MEAVIALPDTREFGEAERRFNALYAKFGGKFSALYDFGDIGRHYNSGSEADYALLMMVARAFGDLGAEKVEEVMRASALATACFPGESVTRGQVWARKHSGGTKLRYQVKRVLRIVPQSGFLAPLDVETLNDGTPEPTSRWPLYTVEQFQKLPEPEWLVENVLAARSLAALYAPAETYKSFVALSLAAAVATGRPWLEKYKVAKGTVVYIVAEGQGFFGRRLAALGLDDSAKLRVVPVPVNLFSAEPTQFAQHLKAKLSDEPIALVVIDTLARSMARGDENSNSDMSTVVAGAQVFQRELGAAVLIVHHTGKDGLTARGAYALYCAADTVLRLDKTADRRVTLSFEKTKDIEKPEPVGLLLRPMNKSLEVSIDPDGVAAPTSANGRPTKESLRREIIDHCSTRQTIATLANDLMKDVAMIRREIAVLVGAGRLKEDGKKPGRGGEVYYIRTGEPSDAI